MLEYVKESKITYFDIYVTNQNRYLKEFKNSGSLNTESNFHTINRKSESSEYPFVGYARLLQSLIL